VNAVNAAMCAAANAVATGCSSRRRSARALHTHEAGAGHSLFRLSSLLTLLLAMGFVEGTERRAEAAPAAAASIQAAQELFYNGQYAEAAELTRGVPAEDIDLSLLELRTSAILFQIRRALGEPTDKEKALKACVPCGDLIKSFKAEYVIGQALARDAVAQRPKDATALFYLGKLDLNFVWLELGTLGHRTGWNEYWEARHSLDASLALDPTYRRARVARAWIDYIVDTRMPWGTGWLLGGGNKKKALGVMHDAALSGEDRYAYAEALFGLWDMQVREKRTAEALESARRLTVMFPNNPEVARFVASGSTRSVR
jgi:tetratricopeptide (TPR) repeat protein